MGCEVMGVGALDWTGGSERAPVGPVGDVRGKGDAEEEKRRPPGQWR